MCIVTCLTRVESLTVLGVTFNFKLRFDSHISHIIHKAARTLYGLKTLRAHGITGQYLCGMLPKPHWLLGFCIPPQLGGDSRAWLRRFVSSLSSVNPSTMASFLPGNFQNVCDIVESLESYLFRSVRANPHHVLFRLLPPEKASGYNLQRSHHLPLPQIGNNFIRRNFLYRMLFNDNY